MRPSLQISFVIPYSNASVSKSGPPGRNSASPRNKASYHTIAQVKALASIALIEDRALETISSVVVDASKRTYGTYLGLIVFTNSESS